MKRRCSTDAAGEASGAATKKKKQKKTKTSKGITPAGGAAPRSMAQEEEENFGEARTKVEEVEDEEDGVALPGGTSDICQALMDRYARSSALQHRHLCASAAAMRSILLDEGLPLTPPAYFAATIAAICDADRGDSDALAALSAFLSVLLPQVPAGTVPPHKAGEAASSLMALLEDSTSERLAAPTVRSLVGSLGLLALCVDLEDWSAVKSPLSILLNISVDRRPKVRRCAQISVDKVFKTLKSSVVIQKASKGVLSLFRSYVPLAMELSSMRDVPISKNLEKSKHNEVLHVLNVVKVVVPNLSQKIIRKILHDLYKLFHFRFSLLTRNILGFLEVLLQQLTDDVLEFEAEKIIPILASYISSGENNPADTLISASTLLRGSMSRLHAAQSSTWIKHLSKVFSSVAGLLISEFSVAKHAANILRVLINQHTDWGIFLLASNQSYDALVSSPEGSVIMSICVSCENVLSACSSVPSEHVLAVISDLFLKTGEYSAWFMRDIVLKLSLWMTNVDRDLHDVKYVQECLGSAVISMGPEKILLMIPISLDMKRKACLNTWLIPILKEYTIGASLQFFVEHIVPLAKSMQEMCNRVHKSSTKRKLLSSVDGLWSLLPAFCHYPTDTAKSFDSLAKILLIKLKEDPSSHQHITAAIKVLVSENRNILNDNQEAENIQKTTDLSSNSFSIKSRVASYHYSQKIACRNVKALASGSMELFKSLVDIFFGSPPEKRAYLKETIGCLASVLGSSIVQSFFSSLLTRLGLVDNNAGPEENEHNVQLTVTDASDVEREVATDKLEEQRTMMMELATAFVEEADKYLIDIIFDYIRPYLSESDGASQCEAYQTLSEILKGNSWFVFAQVDQLMNLLLGLESPVDLCILQRRFSCLHFLFIHMLKKNGEKANMKALLILNEIIRFLKDSKEEVRKLAYDTLLEISSSLKNSELPASQSHHQKLLEMIMGYFSGSPPHIMSGAIAAMSLLIYKDADLYFCVPNLMQSVLVLLENKANEVIKASLGLIKVLVSCLPSTEIKKQLPDITNGILPWSSVSKNHFRSKVRIIVEIVIRKCGIDSVLVMPDKFKGFVKTITEQSQGKANSSNTGRPETALQPSDSSITRKYSRLPKGRQTAKRKKDSNTMDSSARSGNSGQKLFLKRRKRSFEDSSLGGGHSRTSENPRKGHNQRKEPKINRKNQGRKRMRKNSVRGDKGVAGR